MKNISSLYKAVFALSLGICLLPVTETYASTKTNVFAPLVATTTYNQTSVKEATYYFTVALPANTKPLQQVTLTQIQGGEDIEFDAKQSRVFLGTSSSRGENLPFSLTSNASKNNTVTLQFAQPIPSGTRVTIALKPYRNPTYEGVYLFHLKAAAANQTTESQSLGVARLQFYPNSSGE